MNIIPYGHPAWIEVDLVQFKKNLHILKNKVRKKICIPIKANAYGHGLIPVAKAAAEGYADYLAVSCLQEGAQLREAGVNIPILVMGAIHEAQIDQLIHYNLEFSLSSLFKAQLVAKECYRLKKNCRVHLELETGMQRTGMRPESAKQLLAFIQQEKCFELKGIYSHLATADQPNHSIVYQQIKVFHDFLAQHQLLNNPDVICHLANSGGVCFYPESYFDMVRPGLLAFGYYPSAALNLLEGIQPFFQLKARVAFFKVIQAGQSVGYGHRYSTQQQTRIITIPIGYGDGYRRALSNCGNILLRGKRYPIAGMICMDQLMVDIGQDEAVIGEEVVLIGKQENAVISVEEIAEICQTINYEILCAFTERLPRTYKTS